MYLKNGQPKDKSNKSNRSKSSYPFRRPLVDLKKGAELL